jgi:hypothetical protein
MYRFEKTVIGPFVIHKARPSRNESHRKIFAAGVTPQNQSTLNIYIEGRFQYVVGDFEQVLGAGQSSLDLAIDQFPAEVLCVETCIEAPALRYCVTTRLGERWTRQRVKSEAFIIPTDGMLVTLDGTLRAVAAGSPAEALGWYCALAQ